MSDSQKVRLGEVLTQDRKYFDCPEAREYKKLSVKLYGKGVELDTPVRGEELKMKRHQSARPGQVIVSEIWAKKGAIGIVPNAGEGALCTSHFFLFDINAARLDARWLRWIFKRGLLEAQLAEAARGTTGYAAVRPSQFLSLEVPLPPLPEQQRIVSRIDQLFAQVQLAVALRDHAQVEATALVAARADVIFSRLIAKQDAELSAIVRLERGKFSHRPRNDPRFFGGEHPWIQIAEIEGADRYVRTWTQTLNEEGLNVSKKFPAGTLLVSIAATIGAVAILTFDCCVPDSVVAVTPMPGTNIQFAYHYLRFVREHLEKVAPQSAQKNINLQILAALRAPVATPSEQAEVVSELDALESEVDALKTAQAQSRAELDALLPAILDRAFAGAL